MREHLEEDAEAMLELNRDEVVMRYLPGPPIRQIKEALKAILYIRKQYEENGIGSWAVIRKEDNAFRGWCGIKLVNDTPTNGKINYYDIGYRLLPQYWNKGYAFEAAKACLEYAFDILNIQELYATVMQGNIASERITQRLSMLWRRRRPGMELVYFTKECLSTIIINPLPRRS